MKADHDYRDLLRKVLKTEKGLRGYRPAVRHYTADPPKAPPFADETLAAIAGRFPPGSCIGLQQVIECISITWEQASEIRRWALQVGAWPWLRPGIGRKAGSSDPGPSRRAADDRVRGNSRHRRRGGGS